MLKRLLYILLLLLASLTAGAQIRSVWTTIPDSLCPYLNLQQRRFMYDYALKGAFDTIPNQLNGSSCIESVNEDEGTLRVHLTAALTASLTAGKDTITYIQTICAPICSTLTRKYSYSWSLLSQEYSVWDAEITDEEKKQYF